MENQEADDTVTITASLSQDSDTEPIQYSDLITPSRQSTGLDDGDLMEINPVQSTYSTTMASQKHKTFSIKKPKNLPKTTTFKKKASRFAIKSGD